MILIFIGSYGKLIQHLKLTYFEQVWIAEDSMAFIRATEVSPTPNASPKEVPKSTIKGALPEENEPGKILLS